MRVGFRSAIGRYGSALLTAGLAVASLVAVVAADLATPLNGLVGGLFVVALLLGYVAVGRVRRARRNAATIDFVASRLLSVESRLSALDRARNEALGTGEPTDVSEVLADVSLLSDLVRSLAEAMSAQDQEIAALRARLDGMGAEGLVPPPGPPLRPLRPAERPAATPRAPSGSEPEAQSPPADPVTDRIVPSLLPQPDDIPARPVASPDPVQAEARRAAIVAALEAERVDLQLHAIVTLPQRRTRFYEISPRLRLADDTVLAPAEFMPALERLGRAAELDRQVVGRALAIAAQIGERDPEMRLSYNVSAASLRDAGTLAALERVVTTRADLAARLVIEVPQRVWRALSADAAAGIDRMRMSGVAFAVDQATDLRLEGLSLGANGVTFVKLPAALLLGAIRPGADPGPIAHLQPLLAQHGVRIVAERVERDADIPDLIDLGIELAQGSVFGPPRALRADLALPERDDAPEPAPIPAEPATVPFRTFLRRAG